MVKLCGNSVVGAQWATSCYGSEGSRQDSTVCTFGAGIWGLCKTSSKREAILCTWQLTKESCTWCRVITLILCLHLVLIISPVSNFPRKFLFGSFKFRCVDIHYHSWIIRSEAWWRRSNWQSNCYSAGRHSWAAEMWCIMPLNSAEINKDTSSYRSDPTITCLCEEKKPTKPETKPTPSLVYSFKMFLHKGFHHVFFSARLYRKPHNERLSLSFPSLLWLLKAARVVLYVILLQQAAFCLFIRTV